MVPGTTAVPLVNVEPAAPEKFSAPFTLNKPVLATACAVAAPMFVTLAVALPA